MGDKKRGLLHSQLLGIVWISMGLILVAAVAFFSSRRVLPSVENDTIFMEEKAFLDKQEDSVYRSRRKYNGNQEYRRRYSSEDKGGKESFYTCQPPVHTRQPLVVELNTADTTTLMLLHGIGPTFARRIVNYRERLGGFVHKEQLLEVYGFTPQQLEHIDPYIVINADSIRHIDLNVIGLKQLARHPYIEYYQARDLVRLRDHGTRFTCVDDLRTVPSMADSTLQRLLPYIDFAQ